VITPVNIAAAGQVAADGTAVLSLARIATSQYAIVLASFSAAGSPTWSMNVGGLRVAGGTGGAVDIGPRLIAPNHSVDLFVAGGVPNTPIMGQFHGARGESVDEVVQFSGLVGANTIGVTTAGQYASTLERFDTSALNSKTWTLPAGVASVGLAIDVNEATAGNPDAAHSVLPAVMTLQGLPSGRIYLVIVPPLVATDARQSYWAAVNPNDRRITLIAGGPTVNGCFIDVLTSPIVIGGQGGDQLGNLAVTLQKALPALWQAARAVLPFSMTQGAGVTTILVPGVAGQTFYLHDLNYIVASFNAGSFLNWQDTGGGLISADSTDVAGAIGVRCYRFSGLPLASGVGFQVTNPGAAVGGAVRGHVTYSQG
jgi:hypothetical protein